MVSTSFHTFHPRLDHKIPQQGFCQKYQQSTLFYRVIMAQREDRVQEFNPVKVFRAFVAALLLDDGLIIPTEAAKELLHLQNVWLNYLATTSKLSCC